MASPVETARGDGRGDVQRMRAAYPFLVRMLHEDASGDERVAIEREKKQMEAECEVAYRAWMTQRPFRWPYFFAYAADAIAPGASMNGEFVLPLQQRFLEAWAGDASRLLLAAWIGMCRVVFGLADRRIEDYYIEKWSETLFTPIRAVLLDHPQVAQLTDLESLLPIVERELADARKQKAASTAFVQDAHGDIAGYHPVTYWDFYKRLFLPGPSRLAVPLPVGLVLFEGRSAHSNTARPTAADILRDRVRRAPFSASWHPDVALSFADTTSRRHRATRGTLLVHKIMSDAILGVDAQQARSSIHRSQRLSSWHECEIIVQPLVSFHQVQEADVLLDQWRHRHWVHVIFTHVFLGDVCPCEAQKEASEAAAASSSSSPRPHQPDAKRQRLQGRLQLD